MKRLNIALIGFGNMGRTHSYAVQNLKFYYGADDPTATAKIIGVCTSKKETAQIAAEKYGLDKAYWNEDELIFSDETDIVDISTPNLLHYETLKKAIAAGKHIYCEKPLCTKARQAAEIAELIKGTGLKGQIVHNYRFMGPVVRAKQLIEEGRLGKIVSFDISYYHSSSTDVTKPVGWKQDGAYGGGVLWDLGSHAVDLIYHLCGKFRTVDGMQQIAHPLRAGVDGKPWKTDADEAFYLLAELECGAKGTITASKLGVGTNDDLNFTIYGTKGTVKFDLMDPSWLWFCDGDAPSGELGGERGFTRIECVGRYPAPGDKFPGAKAVPGWIRSHVESYHDFLTSILNDRPTCPDFSDAADVTRIIESAYMSAETGRRISL